MLNDFFYCPKPEISDDLIKARVSFNAAHEIFAGHFPGQPVVPGVCTLAIVRLLLEDTLKLNLKLKKSPNIKFLQLLLPAHEPELQIGYNYEDGALKVNAIFSLEEKAVFKMSAVYTLAAETQ